MEHYEYVKTRCNIVPDEISKQSNLDKITVDGWVYMDTRKGMPGLKQAVKLATNRLTKHLVKYGYDTSI